MRSLLPLLALAFLAAPNLFAVEGHIQPWCNWQTGEIEIYQVQPCKDCRYAQGLFQLGHPYEMSDPMANKLITGKFAAAASDNVSLVNSFPYVVPLPLSLPSRFTIPAEAACGACDGTLGVYQVENDLDTVTHASVCPPRSLRDIHVCSSPLSAAVTPDASTLLVTCYDNAVAFIDTATDTVKFTLSTPNAFPAGIALTPDGTQAWVNYYESTGVGIVDLPSGTVARHISLGETTENGMALNPTGTGHLAIIDTLVQNFNVPGPMQGLQFIAGSLPLDKNRLQPDEGRRLGIG